MADRVIALKLELNGIGVAVKDGDQLAQVLKKSRLELKQTDFGSDKYKQLTAQIGGLKAVQKQVNADQRTAAREFEIAADKGKQSYRALNAELVNLRTSIKDLTKAEAQSDFGQATIARIQELDKELKDFDDTIGLNQRNVGNYPEVFNILGGFDFAELATVGGAITAGALAAKNAAVFVAELTEKYRGLRGEIQTITGATGDDLDSFTTRISAIGDTFDVDYKQVLESANAVSQQLGISVGEVLDNIEEGFISGSNANGDFLDQLKEYPTFFAEAGLNADALFNVINRSVKEGIYSDKGADAIKEAAIRLRELPQTAQDALAAIGLSSEGIRKKIDEEGIGAGIESVAKKLNEFEDDSQEVGQAVADIFGGAGEDAGVAFLKSLTDINSATGSLIDSTNEYELAQQRTLETNKEFAAVQNEVSKSFAGVGVDVDNLGTQIKTVLLEGLLVVVNYFRDWYAATLPLREAVVELFQALGIFNSEGETSAKVLEFISGAMDGVIKGYEIFYSALATSVRFITQSINKGKELLSFLGILDSTLDVTGTTTDKSTESTKKQTDAMEANAKSAEKLSDSHKKLNKQVKKTAKEVDDLNKKASVVATDVFAANSVKAIQKTITDFKKELDSLPPNDQAVVMGKLINAEKELEKAKELQQELRNIFTRTEVQPLAPLSAPTENATVDRGVDKRIEDEKFFNDEAVRLNAEKNARILEQEKENATLLAETQELIFGSIQSALGILSDASETRYNRETQAVESRFEREIELAEGNTDLQESLQADLADERARLEREEFERQKKIRVKGVLASAAQGIINILAAPSTIPQPFDTIFKVLRIGFLGVQSQKQIALINSQQAERGIMVESGQGKLVGNILRGQTHRGKNKGIRIAGTNVIAEHGEFTDFDENGSLAVINKRSTNVFGKQLQGMAGLSFPGKGKLMSRMNSYNGFGISFAEEGALIQPDILKATSSTAAFANQQAQGSFGLSMEQIILLANATGKAVKVGAKEGTAQGLFEANRASEREAELNADIGLT